MTDMKPFSPETIKGVGNVGQDPKRISAQGKTNVVVVPVAANHRTYDSESRQVVEHTVWRDLKLFGFDADKALVHVHKGDRVKYEGRLILNTYINNDDEEVISYAVDVDRDGLTIVLPTDKSEGESRRSKRTKRPQVVEDDYDDDFDGDLEDPAPSERRKSRTSRKARSAQVDQDEAPAPKKRSRKPRVVEDDYDDDDVSLEDVIPEPKKRSRSRSRSASMDDDLDGYTQRIV